MDHRDMGGATGWETEPSQPLPSHSPPAYPAHQFPEAYPPHDPPHDPQYGDPAYGYPTAEPVPAKNFGVGRALAVSILVLAIVAVLGVGAYAVFANRGDNSGTSASPAPASSTSPAASPVQDAPRPSDSTSRARASSPTSQRQAPVQSTNRETPSRDSARLSPPAAQPPAAQPSTEPDTPPGNTDGTSSGLPAGLTTRGWTGKITCNAQDEWVYAGGNGSDYAVICVASPSGGLYYRGLYNGGTAEHDIASSGSGYYETVPAGDSYIVISGSDLAVFDLTGASLAGTTFTTVHTR